MKGKKWFHYLTSCVDASGEKINEMIEVAHDITWGTFRRHVDLDQLEALFNYRRSGLHIKDDWGVSFYRSWYDGKRCYYVCHSSIEYIFVKRIIGEKSWLI